MAKGWVWLSFVSAGVVMGRVCVSDQSDSDARASAHDNWQILTSYLCFLLHCELLECHWSDGSVHVAGRLGGIVLYWGVCWLDGEIQWSSPLLGCS